MPRFRGFAIGLVIGVGITLAITAPSRGTIAQDGRCAVIGDVNADGGLNIADAIYTLNYIFGQGPLPVHTGDCLPLCVEGKCAVLWTGQQRCVPNLGVNWMCDDPEFPGQDAYYALGIRRDLVRLPDGDWYDPATDLEWVNEGWGKMNWQAALKAAEWYRDTEYHGHADWRLPNANELATLFQFGNNAFLPQVERWGWPVWTSTTTDGGGLYAWAIANHQGIFPYLKTNEDGYCFVVRGPVTEP